MNTVVNTGIVATGIIAIVELIKSYVPQVSGQYTIILAAILGALAGLIGLDGLNVVTGLLAGLSAVGVHQVATAASGK